MARNILIVGATGSLGSIFARGLTARGHNSGLMARTEADLTALKQSLGPGRSIVIPADACIHSNVEMAMAKTREEFGSVDVVLNVAGEWVQDSLDTPDEEADKAYAAGERQFMRIPYVVGRVASRVFREQGHGLIAHMSTHAVLREKIYLKENDVYGSMKEGGHFFMLRMNQYHAVNNTGVLVTILIPGIVNVPKLAHRLDTEEKRRGAVQPEAMVEWLIDNLDNKEIPLEMSFPSTTEL